MAAKVRHLVTDTPDGDDIFRLTVILFDLGPQSVDVGIDRMFIAVEPVNHSSRAGSVRCISDKDVLSLVSNTS